MEKQQNKKTIVFACAGCSHAGGVAYNLALALDKKGMAEMSCLAGVAAEKPSFLRKIKNRQIMTIDGCPIECSKGIFDKLKIPVHHHIRLKDFGVKKEHPDKDDRDMDAMIEKIFVKEDLPPD